MHNFFLALMMSASIAAVSPDARILQNTFINNTDIGGMTYSEALELLESESSVAGESVTIVCPDGEIAYSFSDFGADYNFAAALDAAMEHSRSGGFFVKLGRSLSAKFKEHHIEVDFAYDSNKATQVAEKIRNDTAISVKEPTYAIEHGSFVLHDGRIGREIDGAALTADIIALLETHSGGKITAKVVEIHPKYTTEDFAAACDLLGTYKTPFNPNLPERTTNLTVASAYLDGHVILPGETFSTSAALRPRTVENGYVRAGQIINGEPDSGIGGGICQISSTLYMAALHAEISVPKRSNHSLMVGYIPPATDAALAEGYIDLVLENNTNHPILIQSIMSPVGWHTINIYGHESRPPGRTIIFESVLLETRPPDGEKVIEDVFLPAGTSQIVSEGLTGAKYELYKIVTENGVTERIKINTSSYRPLQRIVKVGAAASHLENLTNKGE